MTLPLWLLNIGGFLKKVPWQVWAAIAAFAAVWIWGNIQYNAGVDDTDLKWERAAIALQEKADAAALAATAEKEIRDQEFAEGQDDIKEAVDEAKTDDAVGAGTAAYFEQLRNQKDSDSTETTD